MSEELKLLPCRVCGGIVPKVIRIGTTQSFYVKCTSCKMRGPVCKNIQTISGRDLAISAWNSLHCPLAWTTEPPTAPGTYVMIRKDKTVDVCHYFVSPDAEDFADVAYWLGPLPPVFAILCDMSKEAITEPQDPTL